MHKLPRQTMTVEIRKRIAKPSQHTHTFAWFCAEKRSFSVYLIPIGTAFPLLFFIPSWTVYDKKPLTVLFSEHLGRMKITFWCYFFYFSSQPNICSQSRAQMSYFSLKLSQSCLLPPPGLVTATFLNTLVGKRPAGGRRQQSGGMEWGAGALETDSPGPWSLESSIWWSGFGQVPNLWMIMENAPWIWYK